MSETPLDCLIRKAVSCLPFPNTPWLSCTIILHLAHHTVCLFMSYVSVYYLSFPLECNLNVKKNENWFHAPLLPILQGSKQWRAGTADVQHSPARGFHACGPILPWKTGYILRSWAIFEHRFFNLQEADGLQLRQPPPPPGSIRHTSSGGFHRI